MAKAMPVWAIDIGQAALKALKLVPGDDPNALVASAFDYIEHPKILSQPDADAEELVRDALKLFLERNDLTGCRVVLSVPGQAGLIKFIKLPPVEKSRIPDIVKFEARQQIPFALEEVLWDYQQINDNEGEDDEGMVAEVGLFAMKREQIHRALLPLKLAGIEVDVVQMTPISLFNFAAFDRLSTPEAIEAGSLVLMDIGADHTDLVITDGKRIWQRNVPIGGNHFTRALSKEMKLTFANAEHMKKNATKAPDPRAVFTAMRGVFTDFSNEVNRSIGFYNSINRGAKIAKIIGMGNGFKLPGLQKFLQQNLSHEVEKLEKFDRLTGDEVINEPQFVENLPSFAVCYGSVVQGIGEGRIRSNLLPTEIQKARMIRRKKPWVTAAAALLMLGFTGLFLGDWKNWKTITAKEFDQAESAAKSAADRGNKFDSDFKAAVGAYNEVKGNGEKLTASTIDPSMWPQFLQMINLHLPNPEKDPDFKLSRSNPKDQPIIEQLLLHVDEIHPVWREDVDAGWYSTLAAWPKGLMHPYDASEKSKPTGGGWIVQIAGHHYNPKPKTPEERRAKPQVKYGPILFLTQKVLPKFADSAVARQFGFSHFAVVWVYQDDEWTSDKGTATGVTNQAVPLLARAARPAGEGGGAGGMQGMSMPGAMGGDGQIGMMMAMQGGSGGSGRMMGADGGMDMMMMGGMPGYGGAGTAKVDKSKISYLTRTDFLIQFLWKPVETDKAPKTKEELDAALKKIAEELVAARKEVNPNAQNVTEEVILSQSAALSSKLIQAAATAIQQQNAAANPAAAPGSGDPAANPADAKAAPAPAAAPDANANSAAPKP